MLYKFGSKSEIILKKVHPDLVRVLRRALLVFDFSVTDGYRSPEYQQWLFDNGKSKVRPGPNAKHTLSPAEAVDIYPYPINFKQLERFYFLAGVMFAAAKEEGVTIRWGGDWDSDKDFYDQTFMDLGHFELVLNNSIKKES